MAEPRRILPTAGAHACAHAYAHTHTHLHVMVTILESDGANLHVFYLTKQFIAINCNSHPHASRICNHRGAVADKSGSAKVPYNGRAFLLVLGRARR